MKKLFAKNLIKLRIQNDMSQQEFADAIGVSRATANYYENSKRMPSYETLKKIILCFKVDPNQLLGTYQDILEEKEGEKDV